MINLAILLTCYNRKTKTVECLHSVINQKNIDGVSLSIFLVDDGSTDGTAEAVAATFPDVKVIKGNGSLFWAGGMRLAWRTAIDSEIAFNYFMLINDDTILVETAIADLLADIANTGKTDPIMVGTTVTDPESKAFSYGGRFLLNNYNSRSRPVIPNGHTPQLCHLGNANIMLVPAAVVKKIGILSDIYTHGMADYDYTLRARKNGISTYIGSNIGGYCQDDHGNNWVKPAESTLRQRIKYLYSVKGLAYKEYMKFIKMYFPYYLPHSWALLWAKTFFPFIWEKYK